jgi:hypothetical protein
MTSHNNANNTDSEKLIWDDSLDELIDPQIISELTGCERLHLPREVLDGGALPGQVLARTSDEWLCLAEQSYVDPNIPTGRAEDYVLVTLSHELK